LRVLGLVWVRYPAAQRILPLANNGQATQSQGDDCRRGQLDTTEVNLTTAKVDAMSRMLELDPREQHFQIPADTERASKLFLRYLGPASKHSELQVVLYIHGATFPSALSIAHRFDGRSW